MIRKMKAKLISDRETGEKRGEGSLYINGKRV